MIGHGSELSFKAINIELIVRITLPTAPITSPRAVSCLSFILSTSVVTNSKNYFSDFNAA